MSHKSETRMSYYERLLSIVGNIDCEDVDKYLRMELEDVLERGMLEYQLDKSIPEHVFNWAYNMLEYIDAGDVREAEWWRMNIVNKAVSPRPISGRERVRQIVQSILTAVDGDDVDELRCLLLQEETELATLEGEAVRRLLKSLQRAATGCEDVFTVMEEYDG